MTKTEAETRAKDPFSSLIKKDELLRLIRMLDPQYHSPEAGKGSRKSPPAELRENPLGARKSKATLALLRQYFVMRIAQSRGYAPEESF